MQQPHKDLCEQYVWVRKQTELICQPLEIEDYVVQPVVDVSPPKWHLGHSTWFFETFLLKPFLDGYQEFDSRYGYVFNSYYETVGARVIRTDRGNLSRPSVSEVYRYRSYVDEHVLNLLTGEGIDSDIAGVLTLGLNHEQQHQELLLSDIKYILGHNPLFPVYRESGQQPGPDMAGGKDVFHTIAPGMYEIGYGGSGFCFDNECGQHKVWLEGYRIAAKLVSNGEYLQFMNEGGYTNFNYWHAEGWDWVNRENVKAPLYWHHIDGNWMHYTLGGLTGIVPGDPVCHVNFYEAAAFAAWKGLRLPTEAEWEVASAALDWGERWEWTNSAYLPYPGFKRAKGAIGEYNGKFMVNQMVLRGSSVATPDDHSRATYRNFFHPHLRWQFTGIRLVQV